MNVIENSIKSIDFPIVRESLITNVGLEDSKRDAIIRSDNRQILGVVSKKYNIIPHMDGFRKAESALGKLGTFELRNLSVSANGARMYATFMSERRMDVGLNDYVCPTLTLTNSYDGLRKFGFMIGALRLVCTNGMMTNTKLFEMQAKHSVNCNIDDVANSAADSMNFINNSVLPMWQVLKKRDVNAMHVLNEISESSKIPKKIMETVYNQFSVNQNVKLWDIYNAFTWFLSHDYNGSVERRIDLDKMVSEQFEKAVINA